ncbi:hypothetical protein JCM10908_004229 [Rhodotorula pacifica]|uniref:uncharacterized protein n=1 Tax=Rhodotorula pacifica TaxID=1495444 RepID=UPI00316E70F3
MVQFVTALTLVASASTLVSARLEQVRRHGDIPSAHAHLAARAPSPEPFRFFPAPGATENPNHIFSAAAGPAADAGHEDRIALRERSGADAVSDDALEAFLAPLHPFAESAQLSKRSDTPKKPLKCHKKKRPASVKPVDNSAGQSLAASSNSESKQASQRKTWAEKQDAEAKEQKAKEDQKAKDDVAAAAEAKAKADAEAKKESAWTPEANTQLATSSESSHEGDKKKDDSTPVFDGGSKSKGLIGFSTSNCGPTRATPSSVWKVPEGVTLDHLKTVSLEHALATNSVWEPCKPWIPLFEKYGAVNGLPPILLAAIALQESTCNPHVAGDSGGALGLMQITKEKCEGRDNHACADPDFNVRTGAAYLKKEIDNAGGQLLEALGRYNGWRPFEMSYSSATAAAYTGCCECQNNLDYLHQMLNGWLLGRTGYDLGTFKNLAVCHQ